MVKHLRTSVKTKYALIKKEKIEYVNGKAIASYGSKCCYCLVGAAWTDSQLLGCNYVPYSIEYTIIWHSEIGNFYFLLQNFIFEKTK